MSVVCVFFYCFSDSCVILGFLYFHLSWNVPCFRPFPSYFLAKVVFLANRAPVGNSTTALFPVLLMIFCGVAFGSFVLSHQRRPLIAGCSSAGVCIQLALWLLHCVTITCFLISLRFNQFRQLTAYLSVEKQGLLPVDDAPVDRHILSQLFFSNQIHLIEQS